MKYVAGFAGLIVSLFVLTAPAKADVNDFVISDFDARYVINNDVVGGSMQATETINVTFSDNNHGIFRYVPKSYNGYSTKLNIISVTRDGSPEPYTTSISNNNLVLKIGDADKTITGEHSYQITYNQQRIVNFSGNEPEFYWDVNGDGWLQTFEQVQATVTFANPELYAGRTACYTGQLGSNARNCVVSNDGKTAIFKTTKPLYPGENMTIAVALPSGSFIQPTYKDSLRDNIANIVGIVLGIVGALLSLYIWLRHGKDYAGQGITVPEYEPPKNLSPAEVGMLADFSVDSKDLSATLIDLAVRRYVRLHEEVKKILLFTNRSYRVELRNNNWSDLKNFEKTLMEAIFYGTDKKVGAMVPLNELQKGVMMSSAQTARSQISSNLKRTYGLVEAHYPKLFFGLIAAVAVMVGLAFVLQSWGFVAGAIIAGLGVLFSGIFMQRRTHSGVEVYEQIMGLKLYMDVAEKQRLKMTQSVERPYAEPKKTVDLFEKLLPYAVALGVEKSWAKQFDGIMKEQPEWMSSNTAGFSSAYLATSLASASHSFSTNFASSSGTGSSGGGSSGGGGGGGGGGGW